MTFLSTLPPGKHITADDVQMIIDLLNDLLLWTATGVVTLDGGTIEPNTVTANKISVSTLESIQTLTGSLDISGVCTIGTDGGIYQGSGSFVTPTTGLKLWNDGGIGRLAGYKDGAAQWYADTDGKLYAGAGAVILDETGVKLFNSGAEQTAELLSDGSGWLGASDVLAWDTAGVVTLNGSAVLPNTIAGGAVNFGNVPIIDGLVITNNTPSAGYVTWSEFTLTYQGTSYTVAAGNSNLKFVYWNKATSTTVLQASATPPAQAADQFIVIFNESGTGILALFSNIVYADYLSVTTLDAIQTNTGALSLSGVCTIGSSGGVYQGTGTFASPTTGLKIWNDSGVGRIGGFSSSAPSWFMDTNGELNAHKIVYLDAAGSPTNAYIDCVTQMGNGVITVHAGGPLNLEGQVVYIGDIVSVTSEALCYTGDLQPYRNSTDYTGYVFVPLTAGLTSTSWDGDGYSTSAATLIDLSAVFGVPAGVKAVALKIACRDSGSSSTRTWIYFGPGAGQWAVEVETTGLADDTLRHGATVVPCNVDGDIFYGLTASGAGTTDIWLSIWGYWI